MSVLAEAVDAEHAFDRVARDQRDRDEGLQLVRRRPGHDHHPRIEVGRVREHRLPVLRCPTCEAGAELDLVAQNLLGPAVACEHRDERRLRLVRLEDAEGVVRDQLGERVRDPVEQRVEVLLRQHVVEDVRETAV